MSDVNILEMLATWIADNTSFEKGSDLFVHHFSQDAPDRCICVNNNMGSAIFGSDRARVDYVIEFVSRSPDWEQADSGLREIYDYLFSDPPGKVNFPVAAPIYQIQQIMPHGEPMPVGEDENRRHLYSLQVTLNIWNIN